MMSHMAAPAESLLHMFLYLYFGFPQTAKYYSTKFDAPRKETKERKLSANIQKFLQSQKADEARKQREDKQKLDELMAMRDTKSKNKIRKMLKVTKSANKSVLEDAVDADNTAYTLQGPEQPDEDDYGYVSTEAGALYKKLMDKYKACPEEKKFSGEIILNFIVFFLTEWNLLFTQPVARKANTI